MPLLHGIHLPHRKNTAALSPVRMPVPKSVTIPMSMHIGAPAKPVVKVGDEVKVGTLIGEAGGFVSAPVHSSVSGKVTAIGNVWMSNGSESVAVTIESDGQMLTDESCTPPDVHDYDSFIAAVRASGAVGLGGAGFPTAVKLDVKDNAGNTNQRDMTFVINDPSKEVKPVFQSSTPSNNTQIKLNASTNVSVKAAGGNTGTKLLFYKYVVKDPSGTQMNTAYYTLNNAYAFTPKTEGDYTVEVSVQGSDNQTVKKTLTFTATNNPVTNPSTPTATVTNPSSPTVTDPQPSSPTVTDPQPSTPTVTEPDDPDYLMGDVDNNGVVDIRDASLIQKYVTRYSLNVFYEERADIDGDGKIQISDATYIQKLIAGIIK